MLARDRTLLVAIDFQQRMLPHIPERERLLSRAGTLLRAARLFGLPVLATEQRKLGPTAPELSIDEPPIEKVTFNCVLEPRFSDALAECNRAQVILMGIETHICVLQTALHLKQNGYEVHVAVDCTDSRHGVDRNTALTRLSQQGIVLTTAETAVYELLVRADAPEFRDVLALVKERDG
jgi:nicotinamidase-related amidase